MDTFFFTVNATVALLFFWACLVSVAVGDNPFAFIGGVMAVFPVGCYIVAEWICWYRRRDWLKRPLGIFNLLLSAFFLFGMVTNLGEAMIADGPIDVGFIAPLVVGFGLIVAYLAYCGWRRIRTNPTPTKHVPNTQDGC
jgi:hypothetical protein